MATTKKLLRTFELQAELPAYPVPDLNETCEVYLKSLRPLLTDEEYEHSQAVVADFIRDGGQAHELQAVIEARATEHRNWMEEWWLRMAYLMTRETHAIHVNWFGVFPDWGVKLSPVQAAALMMVSTLEFKAALDSETLPPEMVRGAPLCMNQFAQIFGTTRIPMEGEDIIETHSASKHVAVFRNDHVFSVTPYHPDGRMFSVAEVAAVLQQVLDMSSSVLEENEEPSVSVLTAGQRDRWAATRADMMERSAVNRASIREIETALYCLSFDDAAPVSKQEVAQLCFAGDGRNKWFDKSFTTLVFDNGRGGCNAEHSPVDAMVCVTMFDYVVKRTRDKVILERAHLFEPLPRSAIPPPKKLAWELWPALSMAIETASVDLTQLISDVSVRVFKFKHFGKSFIKNYKMHPDFFVQMAIQLAYHRLHGEPACTYETGHTRAFYHGRTETIRACSSESVAFCEAMAERGASAEARYAALRAAIKAHGEYATLALSGRACDRHLLGLYIAAVMSGMTPRPAIFTDTAYKKSGGGGNFLISTSNVGYTPLFGGFAPMHKEGYGACYSILDSRINISTSSWNTAKRGTDCAKLGEQLIRALIDLQQLCIAANPPLAQPSKL